MKHKHAELLIAAAEDADALFKCDSQLGRYEIDFVLTWPEKNWQLVKKPVVVVEYYRETFGGYQYCRQERGDYQCCSLQEEDSWAMKITTTDGVRKAEFK